MRLHLPDKIFTGLISLAHTPPRTWVGCSPQDLPVSFLQPVTTEFYQEEKCHRVEYDDVATQKLMEEARLPRWLIERLAMGR